MSPPDLTKPAATPEQSVHPDAPPPDRAALASAGVALIEVDGDGIESKQDLMSALSDALEFPDYFGGNWDALEECLRDLGWLEAEGYVLLVKGGEALRERDPELVHGLARSWVLAAERWGSQDVPFHLLFAA